MLTVIHCQSLSEITPECHRMPALLLGCLYQYMTYRKAQCAPVSKLTLPVYMETHNEEDAPNESISGNTPVRAPQNTTVDEIKQKTEESPKNESNFMKRVRSFVEERKEWYEERKRRQSLQSKPPSSNLTPRGSVDEKDLDSVEGSFSRERDRSESDGSGSFISSESNSVTGTSDNREESDDTADGAYDPMAMDEIEVIDPSELDQLVPLSEPVAGGKGNTKQRLLNFLKSSSFSSFEDEQPKETLPEEKTEETKMGKLRWKLIQKMKSLDLDAFKDKDDKVDEDAAEKKANGVLRAVDDSSMSLDSESEKSDNVSGTDGPVSEGK